MTVLLFQLLAAPVIAGLLLIAFYQPKGKRK
jgi:hypothetical protein